MGAYGKCAADICVADLLMGSNYPRYIEQQMLINSIESSLGYAPRSRES